MLAARQYRRIVSASAWYDLIATIGFMTPWTFALLYGALQQLAQGLGLPGEFPPATSMSMLMANLMGSVVTVWALLRIGDPQIRFGRYDAAARFLFAIWQVYAVAHGASAVVLAFTVVEIGFGIAQSLPVRDAQDAPAGASERRNFSAS
jgi:hypothetical protein